MKRRRKNDAGFRDRSGTLISGRVSIFELVALIGVAASEVQLVSLVTHERAKVRNGFGVDRKRRSVLGKRRVRSGSLFRVVLLARW